MLNNHRFFFNQHLCNPFIVNKLIVVQRYYVHNSINQYKTKTLFVYILYYIIYILTIYIFIYLFRLKFLSFHKVIIDEQQFLFDIILLN